MRVSRIIRICEQLWTKPLGFFVRQSVLILCVLIITKNKIITYCFKLVRQKYSMLKLCLEEEYIAAIVSVILYR